MVNGRSHRIWTALRHLCRALGHRKCPQPNRRERLIRVSTLQRDRNLNETSMRVSMALNVRKTTSARAVGDDANG